MLAIGTKVRIKPWEEIQKTLDKEGRCDGLYFNSKMQACCGKVYNILSRSSNDYYQLSNIDSPYWISQWFDVVTESDYLNDGSIEQKSLCLALIRQVMSGNEPDVEHLWHYSKAAFPNKIHRGFFYDDYPQDRWIYDTRIAENITDWPCIKLKPEILEEAIKNCFSQYNLQYFKEDVNYNINSWFIFSNTEKPDFWYKVAATLDTFPLDRLSTLPLETVKDTNIEQPIKEQKDEIKFQRKKGSILRGTVPEGNQQSSGKRQTATCSGYLGYQVCTGR